MMNEIKSELKTDMVKGEGDEKYASQDYQRLMEDASMSRAADLKSLTKKRSAKARMDEKLVDNKSQLQLLDAERRNQEMYLMQLHHECDFLLSNFESRHEARILEEVGLRSTESIVTKEEPLSHPEVEKGFDSEKSQADVEANWPPPVPAKDNGGEGESVGDSE